jgi:hypothetical protein
MKLAAFLQTLPLVLAFNLYIVAPSGSQDYMKVTGKVWSEGVSETKSPTPDNPDHPETCPNDKFKYSLADDAVCGDHPRFNGTVKIRFDFPTTDPRPLTIEMPEYTLSVSTISSL